MTVTLADILQPSVVHGPQFEQLSVTRYPGTTDVEHAIYYCIVESQAAWPPSQLVHKLALA